MGQLQSTDIQDSKTLPVKRNSNKQTQLSIGDTKTIQSDINKIVEESSNKRKFIRLGTIRRKLARTLRTGKASDYRRHIRDLVQTWNTREIESFLKEYESLEALKELKINSDKARPKPVYLSKDLEKLYTEKICTDVILEYDNRIYQAHKSILSLRCTYFKNLFLKQKYENTPVKIDKKVDNINAGVFESLIKYIYSGITEDEELVKILPQLGKTFGKLNSLKSDIRTLAGMEDTADVLLIFHNVVNVDNGSNGSIENLFEIPCHSTVLCARSVFFKSLLTEKIKNKENKLPIKLVLSETILPKPYVKIILHCMYTDILDLSSVIKWKVADDGTGEADRLLTTAELAMELYEIGQFLEFHLLMQGTKLFICFK